jgi:hypothetical protein
VERDTVVFTGDWPDNELARSAGLEMDGGSKGPLADTALCTSRPGIFAAGNLIHPVVTADIAALSRRHVAAQVLAHLAGSRAGSEAVRVRCGLSVVSGVRRRALTTVVLPSAMPSRVHDARPSTSVVFRAFRPIGGCSWQSANVQSPYEICVSETSGQPLTYRNGREPPPKLHPVDLALRSLIKLLAQELETPREYSGGAERPAV